MAISSSHGKILVYLNPSWDSSLKRFARSFVLHKVLQILIKNVESLVRGRFYFKIILKLPQKSVKKLATFDKKICNPKH